MGRKVLVVSTVEDADAALRDELGPDVDAIEVVVPVVRQGVLDWLANDERAFRAAAGGGRAPGRAASRRGRRGASRRGRRRAGDPRRARDLPGRRGRGRRSPGGRRRGDRARGAAASLPRPSTVCQSADRRRRSGRASGYSPPGARARHRRRRLHRLELRPLLARRATPTTRSSSTTCSPTRATARNLEDVERPDRLRPRRHRRRRAGASDAARGADRRPSSTSPPSRTTASPSSIRPRSSARTCSARRRCSRRRGAPGADASTTSRPCEVYGDLAARQRRGLHRGDPVPPAHPVQRVEGGGRPRCARVPRDLRSAGHDHATARTTTGRTSSRRR